jgi:hypothetical protein
VTDIYMDSNDLYQLFIKVRVKGFCKEVGRLALGVNLGDAGVLNELLQARYNPSAGQRALQDASPVLLASHVPGNASAGAEEAEEAEQVEPRDAEPQARAPPNAEPRAPPDTEPRGPAEKSLLLRNLEVEMFVDDRRMLQKRKQHELGLQQQAWRKDSEWRAALIDRPFIVLTETKLSKRHIPVWARYSPL